MTDDLRPVVFASPEESLVGDAGIRKRKTDYIQNIWSGDTEEQAAERILAKPEVVALWKHNDARFNQLVEETLALFEHQTLRAIENNVITQALKPTSHGARIGQWVLERRMSQKYGKETKVTVQGGVDVTHHLSELLDDPVTIDGNFRVLDENAQIEEEPEE